MDLDPPMSPHPAEFVDLREFRPPGQVGFPRAPHYVDPKDKAYVLKRQGRFTLHKGKVVLDFEALCQGKDDGTYLYTYKQFGYMSREEQEKLSHFFLRNYPRSLPKFDPDLRRLLLCAVARYLNCEEEQKRIDAFNEQKYVFEHESTDTIPKGKRLQLYPPLPIMEQMKMLPPGLLTPGVIEDVLNKKNSHLCGIMEKADDGTFVKCHRGAIFGARMTREFWALVYDKKFPLFLQKSFPHVFSCKYHMRLVLLEQAHDPEEECWCHSVAHFEDDRFRTSVYKSQEFDLEVLIAMIASYDLRICNNDFTYFDLLIEAATDEESKQKSRELKLLAEQRAYERLNILPDVTLSINYPLLEDDREHNKDVMLPPVKLRKDGVFLVRGGTQKEASEFNFEAASPESLQDEDLELLREFYPDFEPQKKGSVLPPENTYKESVLNAAEEIKNIPAPEKRRLPIAAQLHGRKEQQVDFPFGVQAMDQDAVPQANILQDTIHMDQDDVSMAFQGYMASDTVTQNVPTPSFAPTVIQEPEIMTTEPMETISAAHITWNPVFHSPMDQNMALHATVPQSKPFVIPPPIHYKKDLTPGAIKALLSFDPTTARLLDPSQASTSQNLALEGQVLQHTVSQASILQDTTLQNAMDSDIAPQASFSEATVPQDVPMSLMIPASTANIAFPQNEMIPATVSQKRPSVLPPPIHDKKNLTPGAIKALLAFDPTAARLLNPETVPQTSKAASQTTVAQNSVWEGPQLQDTVYQTLPLQDTALVVQEMALQASLPQKRPFVLPSPIHDKKDLTPGAIKALLAFDPTAARLLDPETVHVDSHLPQDTVSQAQTPPALLPQDASMDAAPNLAASTLAGPSGVQSSDLLQNMALQVTVPQKRSFVLPPPISDKKDLTPGAIKALLAFDPTAARLLDADTIPVVSNLPQDPHLAASSLSGPSCVQNAVFSSNQTVLPQNMPLQTLLPQRMPLSSLSDTSNMSSSLPSAFYPIPTAPPTFQAVQNMSNLSPKSTKPDNSSEDFLSLLGCFEKLSIQTEVSKNSLQPKNSNFLARTPQSLTPEPRTSRTAPYVRKQYSMGSQEPLPEPQAPSEPQNDDEEIKYLGEQPYQPPQLQASHQFSAPMVRQDPENDEDVNILDSDNESLCGYELEQLQNQTQAQNNPEFETQNEASDLDSEAEIETLSDDVQKDQEFDAMKEKILDDRRRCMEERQTQEKFQKAQRTLDLRHNFDQKERDLLERWDYRINSLSSAKSLDDLRVRNATLERLYVNKGSGKSLEDLNIVDFDMVKKKNLKKIRKKFKLPRVEKSQPKEEHLEGVFDAFNQMEIDAAKVIAKFLVKKHQDNSPKPRELSQQPETFQEPSEPSPPLPEPYFSQRTLMAAAGTPMREPQGGIGRKKKRLTRNPFVR
ncbi:hypothetical protein L596_017207 [Steinernema carpocapsae]|uniref:Uncharacterized protein n=1 Tax=Steinernema carpocapsae TaxID=34508 RepID=A0A4V6A1M3_STECR|nr:hypothetical protein L596_017207 [Steinernema carpocapsae]